VPGERGAVVAGEDRVGAGGVFVFAVEEEAVHVEEAGADGARGWGVLVGGGRGEFGW